MESVVESMESAESADKAEFLATMSESYDKYFKLVGGVDDDRSVYIHNPSEHDELNECGESECESGESCGSSEIGESEESCEGDERTAALKALKTAIKAGNPWQEPLWNCVKLHQGYEFTTAGRGRNHAGAVSFTYRLKVSSRTGMTTDELIISTRKASKTGKSSSMSTRN